MQVLVLIIGPLDLLGWLRAERACRAFRNAVSVLLRSLAVLNLKQCAALGDASLSALLRRCPTLRRVALDAGGLGAEQPLRLLPDSVTELDISGIDHHTDTFLSNLPPALQVLRIAGFSPLLSAACLLGQPPARLRHPPAWAAGLTTLALDGPDGLNVSMIVASAAAACPALTSVAACDVRGDALRALARRPLRALSLKAFRPSLNRVNDAGLATVATLFPALEELSLCDSGGAEAPAEGGWAPQHLSDTGLGSLAPLLPRLRSLCLRLPAGCGAQSQPSGVTVTGLCFLAAAAVRLEDLELACFGSALSDAPLLELISLRGAALQSLVLDQSAVGDAVLEAAGAFCPGLRSLSLKHCGRVKRSGLRALGSLPCLETLNLAYVHGLSNAALDAVLGPAPRPRMRCLVLNATPSPRGSRGELTNAAAVLLRRCPGLRELALQGQGSFGCAGVEELCRACPKLHSLCLAGTDVGDRGVHAAAAGLRRLLKLRLDGCNRVSDPSLRVLGGLRLLRSLSLQATPRLSPAGLSHLLTPPPQGSHGLGPEAQRFPSLRMLCLGSAPGGMLRQQQSSAEASDQPDGAGPSSLAAQVEALQRARPHLIVAAADVGAARRDGIVTDY